MNRALQVARVQTYTYFNGLFWPWIILASSFAINTKMKRADAMLKAYGVDSTPTLIVNGKYRLTTQSAGGVDKIVPLIQFLLAKDAAVK